MYVFIKSLIHLLLILVQYKNIHIKNNKFLLLGNRERVVTWEHTDCLTKRKDKIHLHKHATLHTQPENWKQWPEMRARSQMHTKLLHQNKNKQCINGEIHYNTHCTHITQACHSAGGWDPGHAGKFVCHKLYNQLGSCSQEWIHLIFNQKICISKGFFVFFN